MEDTCEWIAKDLHQILADYQGESRYKQAMTPTEVLDQFHKEVRGSYNRLSLNFFQDALEKQYPADIVDAILGDWYLIGTDVRDGRSFFTHERKQQLLEHAQTLQRQMEAPRLEARVKARLSRGDLLPSVKTVEQQFPEISANDYYRRSIPVDFLVKQALVAQSIKNPARFALNDGERFAFQVLGLDKELEEVKLNTYQKIATSLRNSGQFTEEKLKTQTVEKIKEEIDRIALVEKLKLVDIPPDFAPQIRSLVQFYQEMAARYEPAIQTLTEEVQGGISREYGSTLLGQSLKKIAHSHIRIYFRRQYSHFVDKKAEIIIDQVDLEEKDFAAFLKNLLREQFSGDALSKTVKEIQGKVAITLENQAKWTKKWGNPWEFEMQQGLNDEQECLVAGICWAVTSRLANMEQRQPELTHEQQKEHFAIQPSDRFYQASYKVNPKKTHKDNRHFLPKQLCDKLGIHSVDPLFTLNKSNASELGRWTRSDEVKNSEGVCRLSLQGGSGENRWGHAVYLRCDYKRGIFYFFDPNGGKSKSFNTASGESAEQASQRMLNCFLEWLDAEYSDYTNIDGYTISLERAHKNNEKGTRS